MVMEVATAARMMTRYRRPRRPQSSLRPSLSTSRQISSMMLSPRVPQVQAACFLCASACASRCLQGHLAKCPRQTVGLVEFRCFVPRNLSTRSRNHYGSHAQPRKDFAAGGNFFAVCTWQAEPSTPGKWRAGEEVAAHPARVSFLDPLPNFLPKERKRFALH